MDDRPIHVTEKAVEMAKRKIEKEGDASIIGLRLGVKGGGCSGFSYVFQMARGTREGRDHVYDYQGLKVVVDHKSAEYLKGCTLDWEQKLMGYGFKWINPRATGTCGCGESFRFGD